MAKYKVLMDQNHPKWEEFLERLAGPEGCDFKQSDPKDFKSITWKCSSDFELAKKILSSIPDVDIDDSLIFFTSNGGGCDCEILFNLGQK